MDVGERLKQIRKLKGISQRELAKRAGVTNSTISMIEKNGVSPSVSSLKKILACVPISIGDFFTDEAAPEKVVFRADEQPDVGTDNVKLLLIGATVKDRTTNIMREYYPPGADTGADMLQHEGEEGGVILKGEIELTVGQEVYNLKEGDGYYFNSSLPHRFRNTSDEECQIISSNPAS